MQNSWVWVNHMKLLNGVQKNKKLSDKEILRLFSPQMFHE
jgi:hypothetical protein